jgi:hypothetical protein
VAFCGTIKYQIEGGNTPYLNFVNEENLILHSTSETDLTASSSTNFSHKVKAFPETFTANEVEATFQVTLNPACTLTG